MLRRCLVTGESAGPERLIRFVVGPDGSLVPDLAAKLPGRGIWVTASRPAIAAAVGRRLFARAARGPVMVPPDLAERLERLLAARCLDLLGLARRAGQAVAGYEKVRAALASGRVAVLVAAFDGAADGRRKLRQLAAGLPVVEVLSAAELSLALGRENVIHAALTSGRLASTFLAEAARLAGLRILPEQFRILPEQTVQEQLPAMPKLQSPESGEPEMCKPQDHGLRDQGPRGVAGSERE